MASVHDILVIGAGPAGLAAATTLQDLGLDVLVLEAAAFPGGHASRLPCDTHVLARGPQGLLGSATSALHWIDRLGLTPALVPAAGSGTRFLYREGRLAALPTGPLSFALSRFLSVPAKLRLLTEPWRRRPVNTAAEESVAAFFTRRLGAEAADALAGTFVSGVHAGDPATLEAQSAFKGLVAWERDSGSLLRGALRARRLARGNGPHLRGLHSLQGGLATLSNAAAARLGARLMPSAMVQELRHERTTFTATTEGGEHAARSVILATPPHVTAGLLEGIASELAQHARAVPMAPVAVVHLGGTSGAGQDRRPAGHGVLVARGEGFATLGTLFTSCSFPSFAPPGEWLQATYLGGALAPHLLDENDDDSLVAIVSEESRRLLGFDPPRDLVRVVRHDHGIPQCVQGHAARVARCLDLAQSLPGLALAGNWLHGVSLDSAVASGFTAAGEVAALLTGRVAA